MRSVAPWLNTCKWFTLVFILTPFLYGCPSTYLSLIDETPMPPSLTPSSQILSENKISGEVQGHKGDEIYTAAVDESRSELLAASFLNAFSDARGTGGSDSLISSIYSGSADHLSAVTDTAQAGETLSAGEEDEGAVVEDDNGLEKLEEISPPALALEEEDIEETELSELLKMSNGRVEFFIEYFQTRGAKAFQRWLSRSGRYLPIVKEIVKENGLPEEIAYLPLIESGFNPHAYSRAKAVGMWQFIEGTAKRYGLRVDWWIDERRDIERSTYAAIRYLKDLYATFGSWPLALTAYNAGEGKVMRAIKSYKPVLDGDIGTEDYWEILDKRLFKRETKNYIPKFIAAVTIAKDPERYGFTNMEYEELIVYEKVILPDATDLQVVARAAGVSVDEIMRLNPELKRWFTPPNYPDYEIRIPYGSKDTFVGNISRVPPTGRLAFHKHKVRYGETLSHIARRYETPVKEIAYLNRIDNPRRLRAGGYIVVPVRAAKSGISTASSNGSSGELREAFLNKITYTVKRGDTLWNIAKNFDVEVSKLYQWNGLEKGVTIYPGDRITVDLSQRDLRGVIVD